MFDFFIELQLFVVNPKTYALSSAGRDLPLLPRSAPLDDQVPVWKTSVQCLIDDQRAGGQAFSKALSQATGLEIDKVVAQVRFAGWRDDACVALVISLRHTRTNTGILLTPMTQEMALRIANWLRRATAADLVAAVQPYKHIRVECRGTEGEV